MLFSGYCMWVKPLIHEYIKAIQEDGYCITYNNERYDDLDELRRDLILQICQEYQGATEMTRDISIEEAVKLCGVFDDVQD